MPQDAFTIKHTVKELNSLLVGGKINKITQPTPDEVYLSVYTTKGSVKVVISANAVTCRVSLTDGEKPNPLSAYNFCMLLRKHLTGGTITDVEMIEFERVIKISFDSKNDFFEIEQKQLYVEIMGKYSNVILTGNGTILGCMKPSSFEVSNVRPILTGMKYSCPPPQNKILYTDEKQSIDALKEFTGGNLAEFLFSRFKGICSQTATEICFKYLGCDVVDGLNGKEEQFYRSFVEYIETPPISPCIIRYGDKEDVFVSNYKHIEGERQFFPDVLSAISFYYENKDSKKEFDTKKRQLLSKLSAYEKKQIKKLQIISEKENSCLDMEQNKIKGELITANLYALKQGQTVCDLYNYYDEEGKTLKINLDKTLSPNQNAQKYFKKYQKQKKTLVAIEPQKQDVLKELEYINSLKQIIEQTDKTADFLEIEDEMAYSGIIKLQSQQKKKKKPTEFRTYQVEGFTIKSGKNNLQNNRLLDESSGGDIWLHTKDFHSSHVIIESKNQTVPNSVIQIAAEICVYYSGAKNGSKIPVDYTSKKNVKKPSGAKPGFVNYFNYKTCYVDSCKHEEFLVR